MEGMKGLIKKVVDVVEVQGVWLKTESKVLRSFVWISRKQVQITRGMGEGVVQATCNMTPVTELTTEVVMKRTIVRGDVKRDKQVP